MQPIIDSADQLTPMKRAILEIRELRARLGKIEQQRTEPIAIVGAGLRLPGGVHDLESYWDLLRSGRDAITEVPPTRWDIDQWYDADPVTPGRMYTRHGGFLDAVDVFSPSFFGINGREAASMDPQQRLLLEVAWEALEHAGQSAERLSGARAGVFIGLGNSDYGRMLARDPGRLDVYFATGNAPSVAAGRIAYLLGLEGPAVTVDTACSSSLTAVHLACQSLRARECDLVLAGGVNLILSPEINVTFSKAQMMAVDGRCKTFDARADGYVRGEGCGVVVLKRLSDALANRDRILAVVRGSAINQDGRSNGLTAPNGPSQVSVIREALADAGVAPEHVGYVETHGTGTSLGDPIEVQALGEVLCRGRSADQVLMLGAAKTNIGHLEAAAGVAGLLKAVLVLRHGEIPPNLHFSTPNPLIPWEQFPLAVPTTHQHWPAGPSGRIASVSAFGFSGTNTHVVLAAAPDSGLDPADRERPLHILPLSAKSDTALQALVERYRHTLSPGAVEATPARLADICFTAATGRSHFEHRLAVSGSSAGEINARLTAFTAGQELPGMARGTTARPEPPSVAFLFTGHGAQYVQMGYHLFETQPTFRAALERCDAVLQPILGRSLFEILYPSDGDGSWLDQMAYGQPALFALQYALSELWRSWGVEPTVVVGHSIGEYAAACVVGLFSLEDGLRLTAARGRLLQSIPQHGAMAAVFADEGLVTTAIARHRGQVTIAAVNASDSTVISGPVAALDAVLTDLRSAGIEVRRLRIAQASHSPLVDPVVDDLVRAAADVAFRPPRLALVSSMTGQLVSEREAGRPDYWGQHLRQPVRFADAYRTVLAQRCDAFIEIGPHPVLIGTVQRADHEARGVWAPSLRRGRADWEQLLESVGALYVNGVSLDWEGFDRDYPRRRTSAPTYPWDRQRYWADWIVDAGQHRTEATDEPPVAGAAWTATVSAAERQAGLAPLDLHVDRFSEIWARMDRLATAYVVQALRSFGLFSRVGESLTLDEVMAQCRAAPTYRSLIERWLGHLVEDGLVVEVEAHYRCLQPLPAPPLSDLDREAAAVLADAPQVLDWMRRCGQSLAAVISGAESSLETLFPAGSCETVDFIYQQWSLARYFNGIVRSVVESRPRRNSGGMLRVFEIGAGTGGTTASLLPALDGWTAEYQFTDVSDFFLTRAQERFAAYGFVQYGRYDLECVPAEQGYASGSYDVVVGANVVHAARDLDAALAHARDLLSPGGLLVLYETTTHPRWMDVTTGLIEGWQRFEDAWRGNHPLLTAERWDTALRTAGFDEVLALPRSTSPAAILGQHVILARCPSAARDRLQPPASSVPGPLTARVEPPPTGSAASQAESAVSGGLQRLREMLPDERHEQLVTTVRAQVLQTLRLEPSQPLDRHLGLMELGLDSLMAIELRDRLTRMLGLERRLPATLVFDFPTIDAIASYLGGALAAPHAAPVPQQGAADRSASMAAGRTDVGSLSDDEVEALLLAKLENL
ncbi:MAG: acyltransferase domain-containing protein [Chloroflexi bacterium]|nr:acyltransferase domain-containing protein [Chloroflexota bacterium]